MISSFVNTFIMRAFSSCSFDRWWLLELGKESSPENSIPPISISYQAQLYNAFQDVTSHVIDFEEVEKHLFVSDGSGG